MYLVSPKMHRLGSSIFWVGPNIIVFKPWFLCSLPGVNCLLFMGAVAYHVLVLLRCRNYFQEMYMFVRQNKEWKSSCMYTYANTTKTQNAKNVFHLETTGRYISHLSLVCFTFSFNSIDKSKEYDLIGNLSNQRFLILAALSSRYGCHLDVIRELFFPTRHFCLYSPWPYELHAILNNQNILTGFFLVNSNSRSYFYFILF